jgi:isoleucyl-tRNA synthetase
MNADKQAAYDTLYECLSAISKLMSPMSPFFSDWLYRSLNEHGIAAGTVSESEHLTDFPVVNAAHIDAYLEKTMDVAETTCSLVLSLRKKEKLKVRQPLQKIMVPVLTAEFAAQLTHVSDLIAQEVNVKEVLQIDAGNDLIVKKVKPDFKALGPKLGADMKLLAQAVNGISQAQIRQLEQEGSISLDLESRQFQLELGEVEILTQDMPGWTVASDKGITVALDITLTEALIHEGIAREFVNRVQNLRKDSGLEITDRIEVQYVADESVQKSIQLHLHYICNEVLANTVTYVDGLTGSEAEVNDMPITLNLNKL